jgi:hypothetical protein
VVRISLAMGTAPRSRDAAISKQPAACLAMLAIIVFEAKATRRILKLSDVNG